LALSEHNRGFIRTKLNPIPEQGSSGQVAREKLGFFEDLIHQDDQLRRGEKVEQLGAEKARLRLSFASIDVSGEVFVGHARTTTCG